MGGGGGGGSVPKTPPFEPGTEFPTYISPDRFAFAEGAAAGDKAYYQRSDQDFKRRHRGLFTAEKLFEAQTLKDQQGESELTPALQAEFVRSGLIGANSSLGDVTGTLAPGSGTEAAVARNLGLSIMGFQDRNRQNRQQSLTIAEQLFPRRTFGLSGSDLANLELAKYNADVGREELNWRNEANNNAAAIGQGNADAQADAQKKQAMIAGGAAIAGTLVLAF